MDLGS